MNHSFTAHQNARSYFKFYVTEKQYEVQATERLMIGVELNGSVHTANVIKVDRILALIHFEKANRFEWMYVGSPRISQLYRSYVISKKLDRVIEFKTYSACRTDDVILVDTRNQHDDQSDRSEDSAAPLPDSTSNVNDGNGRRHKCSPACVLSEIGLKWEHIDSFRRPILCGWKRNGQYYRTPCGLNLYSLSDIHKYLAKTGSKLRIDCFDFTKNIDPTKKNTQIAKIPVSFCLLF